MSGCGLHAPLHGVSGGVGAHLVPASLLVGLRVCQVLLALLKVIREPCEHVLSSRPSIGHEERGEFKALHLDAHLREHVSGATQVSTLSFAPSTVEGVGDLYAGPVEHDARIWSRRGGHLQGSVDFSGRVSLCKVPADDVDVLEGALENGLLVRDLLLIHGSNAHGGGTGGWRHVHADKDIALLLTVEVIETDCVTPALLEALHARMMDFSNASVALGLDFEHQVLGHDREHAAKTVPKGGADVVVVLQEVVGTRPRLGDASEEVALVVAAVAEAVHAQVRAGAEHL
mmetsp:Transcript_6399/g.18745  ORF Transcript_6399/g.18745 Transcript_6399/m.18745 type:complete len:287 (-) Transcript_6399:735-1595(-)